MKVGARTCAAPLTRDLTARTNSASRLSEFCDSFCLRKLNSISNLIASNVTGPQLYTPAVEYEWDPEKDRINQEMRGISFAEASTVFLDPLAATVPDDRYAYEEFRFRTTGYTLTNRLIIVAHTERNDRIRIITARTVTPKERRQYEQQD